MKNSYDVLSPFFLKFAGFCVSIYLYILCLQLFEIDPIYIFPKSSVYHQINIFLIWAIVIGVFALCVFFSLFTFMKIGNSSIYLFNIYLLYFISSVLLLFILGTRAGTVHNADMMMRMTLCLGFLFIFLEFLHVQTSPDFVKDKRILAGIMGIATFAFILLVFRFYNFLYNIYIVAFLPFILYALRVFVLSMQGKEYKSSVLFKCSFIAFLFLWSMLTVPNILGMPMPSIINPLALKVFVIFGCIQLIPSVNRDQLSGEVKCSLLTRSIIDGVFLLSCRFLYFALLAEGVAYTWM